MLGSDELDDGLGSAVAIEDLTLAEDDVLLKVHRNRVGSAEVFHGLGDLDPELFRHLEICVDGMA